MDTQAEGPQWGYQLLLSFGALGRRPAYRTEPDIAQTDTEPAWVRAHSGPVPERADRSRLLESVYAQGTQWNGAQYPRAASSLIDLERV